MRNEIQSSNYPIDTEQAFQFCSFPSFANRTQIISSREDATEKTFDQLNVLFWVSVE